MYPPSDRDDNELRRERRNLPVPQNITSRSDTIGRSNRSTGSQHQTYSSITRDTIPNETVKRKSIYQEIEEVLLIICVSTLLVEIRAMDRRESIRLLKMSQHVHQDWRDKDSYQNISYPVSIDLACALIKMNKKRLQGKSKTTEQKGDGSRHGHRMDLFHTLEVIKYEEEDILESRTDEVEDHREACIIESVVDDGVSGLLMHTVHANRKEHLITLCFSPASTSTNDWLDQTDALDMKRLQNPMNDHDNQSHCVYVHPLIVDCLFSSNRRKVLGPRGHLLTEYHCIVQETLLPILEANPGYKLRVCGHGFGAALATVFSFVASSESSSLIPKPVNCVTYGCPLVGDEDFTQSYRLLESLGWLRHFRVSHDLDDIVKSPFKTEKPSIVECCGPLSVSSREFSNTFGTSVTLHNDNNPCTISWPRKQIEKPEMIEKGFMKSPSSNDFQWDYHNMSMYKEAVKENKALLESLSLGN